MVAAFCFLKGGFYLKETFFYEEAHCNTYILDFISYGWMLAIINACNLVDVMDGLLATIALCATVSCMVMAILLQVPTVVLLLAAFFGSLIAFLWFNKPVAAIYLGDAGSLYTGGVLGVIPFMIPWGTYNAYGFLAPLLILFIPLAEIATLICIRTYRGIPFYQGSSDHFSLYLKRKGWSVGSILGFVVASSVVLLAIAIPFVFGLISCLTLISLVILLISGWLWVIFSCTKV